MLDLARIKSKETAVMEADLRARNADVRRTEAVLADLSRKLQLTTIHSPVAGIVVKKNAHTGEVIQSGHPIYMVVDASRYWIEANVEETEIRFIRPGSPVIIKVDSYPDQRFDGKVIEVGDNFLTIEISDKVRILVQRFLVTSLVPKGTFMGA